MEILYHNRTRNVEEEEDWVLYISFNELLELGFYCLLNTINQ